MDFQKQYDAYMSLLNKSTNKIDTIISPVENVGGLYLGDYFGAQDLDHFKKAKISCVLTVAASASDLSLPKTYCRQS